MSADIAWVSAFLFLMAYEGWAVTTHHTTLSQAMWQASHTRFGPLLPFLAGLLCGHLFWSGQ